MSALTVGEMDMLVFVLGVLVLLGAAYVTYRGRLPEAALLALIGVLLLFVAS